MASTIVTRVGSCVICLRFGFQGFRLHVVRSLRKEYVNDTVLQISMKFIGWTICGLVVVAVKEEERFFESLDVIASQDDIWSN